MSDGFWAVHPGAGKKQNIWPATAFAEVIRQAVADGRQVLVLHGPADVQELAHLMDLLSDIPAPNICVAPAAPIGVGAALLQHANRFLCNDTGVMHLAGAVNTPTIALFGPTDPKFWKPPTEAVQAVCSDHQVPDDRGPEFGWMEQIPVQRVWQAWRSLPTPTDKF